MQILISLIFLLVTLPFSSIAKPAITPFRLHLVSEPLHLDPNKQRSSASSYLLGNLYRNIYLFDDSKGLISDLGDCKRSHNDQTLTCHLKKDLRWSDGTEITSADFLRTYLKILDPKEKALRADLLFRILNAEKIYTGKAKPASLGIKTPDKFTLLFSFTEPDPDFEYNLANFILSPTKPDLTAYSGPYKLKQWNRGKNIQLSPNTYYQAGNKERPEVEFLFIEEDSVALQLYEKNELHFLRRLPTLFIPRFKDRSDFQWAAVTRFDYIGFGQNLKQREDLRKAFTHSLNYPELQKIFSAQGLPGCVGLPDSWFPNDQLPCVNKDSSQGKLSEKDKTSSFTFMFSSLGGEDHKRATEWMQDQWRKKLGITVSLIARENKIFLQTLQEQPPDLFRKGVAIDRPTCLAALETFSEESPENYIALKDPAYAKILKDLSVARSITEKKKLCLSGVRFLLDRHLLIPLGPIHFAILSKSTFTGWKLNQMNQLDLQDLKSAI